MRTGINAGFGSWIGYTDLDAIQERKFSIVRQDIATSEYLDILSLVGEFERRPLMPLLLIGSGKPSAGRPIPAPDVIVERAVRTEYACRKIGIPFAIEVYNEPDINGVSPETFASTIRASVSALSPGTTVVTGGISSTSKPGLAFLRAAFGFSLWGAPVIPDSCIVGVHTYRSGPPDKPLPGFPSRQDEFDELRSIVGSRRIWNSEIGWNDFEKRGGLIPSICGKPLTQEQVASNLRREIQVCAANGLEVVVVFQLRDGLGADEHFGIRTVDGQWKKSADVAKGV